MAKRPMDTKKAVRLALAALQAEVQRLAVDANMYERFGEGVYPGAKLAYQRRQELREAITLLESEQTKPGERYP